MIKNWIRTETKCGLESCDKIFLARKLQKYCSKKCQMKAWALNNPQRVKQLGKIGWEKHKIKHPILCSYCRKPIPLENRKSGLTYCSDECRKTASRKNNSKHYQKSSEKFAQHKIKIGCQMCGYHRFAGALDYHHKYPEIKDQSRKLSCKMFIANSKKFKEEEKKCILVCKNCHYELHNYMRNDMNKYRELLEYMNQQSKCLIKSHHDIY